MKKTFILVLILALLVCVAPAHAEESAEQTELIVFGAASLTEALTQIGEAYGKIKPNVTLIFNFDSSGTLKTQIQEGADCDLFISAGQKQMNQLDIRADVSVNVDGLDYVLENSRVDLLENKIALCVPEGNPKNILSFVGMADALEAGSILLGMGNSDVPVGQYTSKIFAYFGLNEEEIAGTGCLTYGTNVKEVVTQIAEAAVDCGVVYQTDAASAGLTVVDTATAEMCGQVVYPAAVISTSDSKEEALAFLAYLQGEQAAAVFTNIGFTALGATAD